MSRPGEWISSSRRDACARQHDQKVRAGTLKRISAQIKLVVTNKDEMMQTIPIVGRRLTPGVLAAFLCATALFWTASASRAQKIEAGKEQKALTPDLKPGDYVWQPEVSPAGPVAVIVSLAEQTMYVYRNGVRIGRSTVSSGKDGHKTPTGVFTILEKNVTHHSSAYHEASMPYQERLTWGGVAIHAGNLPGYPESHGCIHVPMDFAKKLYEVTDKGTTVLVTDAKAAAPRANQPGLLFSANQPGGAQPSSTAAGDGGPVWKPEAAPTGPVSILLSSADKRIYVYRDGVEIGRATTGSGEEAGRSYGNHVYAALAQTTPDGFHEWNALGGLDDSTALNVPELRQRLAIAPDFLAHVREVVTPGTTLVITDQSVDETTQSKSGFNVLDAGGQ